MAKMLSTLFFLSSLLYATPPHEQGGTVPGTNHPAPGRVPTADEVLRHARNLECKLGRRVSIPSYGGSLYATGREAEEHRSQAEGYLRQLDFLFARKVIGPRTGITDIEISTAPQEPRSGPVPPVEFALDGQLRLYTNPPHSAQTLSQFFASASIPDETGQNERLSRVFTRKAGFELRTGIRLDLYPHWDTYEEALQLLDTLEALERAPGVNWSGVSEITLSTRPGNSRVEFAPSTFRATLVLQSGHLGVAEVERTIQEARSQKAREFAEAIRQRHPGAGDWWRAKAKSYLRYGIVPIFHASQNENFTPTQEDEFMERLNSIDPREFNSGVPRLQIFIGQGGIPIGANREQILAGLRRERDEEARFHAQNNESDRRVCEVRSALQVPGEIWPVREIPHEQNMRTLGILTQLGREYRLKPPQENIILVDPKQAQFPEAARVSVTSNRNLLIKIGATAQQIAPLLERR